MKLKWLESRLDKGLDVGHDFLPDAMALEKNPPDRAGRVLIWAMSLLFMLICVWSLIGSVDIVTTAQGKVIPDGKSKLVQPMLKGRVESLHVRENQTVTAGQLLVSLDATEVRAEKEQLQQHAIQLDLEVNRYAQMLDWLEDENHDYKIQSDDYVLMAEWKLYQEKVSEHNLMTEKLMAERKRTQLEVERHESVLPILLNKEKNLKKLSQKNLTSEQQYLDQKQLRLETGYDLKTARVRVEEIDKAVEALQNKKNLLKRQTQQEFANKHETARENLNAAEKELEKQSQQIAHHEIRASVKGRVTQLNINGAGQVVTPAENLMLIVPETEKLEIEAFVKSSDIGFLDIDQDVQIKVDAYPFTRYGMLTGRLAQISGDAMPDENSGLVYRVAIVPEQNYLMAESGRLALVPGMSTSVEVITGKRRLIDYFLSPLQQYTSESIRER